MQEGTIYTALSGALSQKNRLDTVSNNLANANTNGFKADRLKFDSVMSQEQAQRPPSQQGDPVMFPVMGKGYTDDAMGPLKQTGRDLDFAIGGEGFFRVRDGDEVAYTRDGKFFRNGDGGLVDKQGRAVLGPGGQPVTIPEGKVTVDDGGALYVGERAQPSARLSVVRAEDRSALEKVGDNLYRGPEEAMAPSDGAEIKGGYLEGSNVDPMAEMTRMIELQRGHQSIMKAMKTVDRAYTEAGRDLASSGR